MNKPKILFFDVETSPILAYIWRPGSKINISHEQIKKGERTEIICICYKFLGDKKVTSLSWDMKKQSSEKIIEAFTKVIESADIVIGHNADSFDIKHINTQRFLHGQKPIAWPTSEDTVKNFRKIFSFAANRLDYLSKILLGAGKASMEFNDWVQIKEHRSYKHLDKMVKYCKRDVTLLEGIWKKASVFFPTKAHRGIIIDGDRDACPHCGSKHVKKNGYKITVAGKYSQMQCQSCGHHFKGRKV